MIVRATAYPAYLLTPPLLNPPLLRPRSVPAAPFSAGPKPFPAGRGDVEIFRAELQNTRWIELDDTADAAALTHEAAAADAALLRCVACVAFATLVLALVSSLRLA
jgi:hypothetical protein